MRHRFWQAHEYITIVCRSPQTGTPQSPHTLAKCIHTRDKEQRLKDFPCLIREHVICMFSAFLPSRFNPGMFDANKICIKSVSIKSLFIHRASVYLSHGHTWLDYWINAYILVWSIERRFLLFLTPYLISGRLKNDLPCKRLPWRKMPSDWWLQLQNREVEIFVVGRRWLRLGQLVNWRDIERSLSPLCFWIRHFSAALSSR